MHKYIGIYDLCTVWELVPFFTGFGLPLKKAWLSAPWSRFKKILLPVCLPAPNPSKKARLPVSWILEAVLRSFYQLWLPVKRFNGYGSCSLKFIIRLRLRIPNTEFMYIFVQTTFF